MLAFREALTSRQVLAFRQRLISLRAGRDSLGPQGYTAVTGITATGTIIITVVSSSSAVSDIPSVILGTIRIIIHTVTTTTTAITVRLFTRALRPMTMGWLCKCSIVLLAPVTTTDRWMESWGLQRDGQSAPTNARKICAWMAR